MAHSPKDRSRSPHRNHESTVNQTNSSSTKHSSSKVQSLNGSSTSSLNDTTSNEVDNIKNNDSNHNNNSKVKKENEAQLRMKALKSFIQTFMNDSSSSSLGATYDEQVKTLETACIKEFRDLSTDRIRRMIRNVYKARKSQQTSSSTNSFLHQEHTNILPTTTDRFNANEHGPKKNRSNSNPTNPTTKSNDLAMPPASTLSALDADFLRHAFSQQFHPTLDLSAYFSAAAVAAASNGTGSTSPLFRPNFSSSNFLQTLTTPPPTLPAALASSHLHTNGTTESSTGSVNKSSKQIKLSNSETNSIKVLINAYREAASYLSRSADELEQLI